MLNLRPAKIHFYNKSNSKRPEIKINDHSEPKNEQKIFFLISEKKHFRRKVKSHVKLKTSQNTFL